MFIDDILVYLTNECEHMDHLIVVLQVLNENKIFFKYSKCKFWLRSAAFRGHIFSTERVEVDPRKIEAVKNCPKTLTQTDISIFLGLTRYYRQFVDGFASIPSPLTTLTQKSVKFEWS